MTSRYRLLTAAILQASTVAPVRSRIVPAAARFPWAFSRLANLLAE
jgi:hypothetical protein